MKFPVKVWIGTALVAAALIALPFALAYAGTAWVRIANFQFSTSCWPSA